MELFYNGGPVESRIGYGLSISNGAIFNDLEQLLTQFSRSRYILWRSNVTQLLFIYNPVRLQSYYYLHIITNTGWVLFYERHVVPVCRHCLWHQHPNGLIFKRSPIRRQCFNFDGGSLWMLCRTLLTFLFRFVSIFRMTPAMDEAEGHWIWQPLKCTKRTLLAWTLASQWSNPLSHSTSSVFRFLRNSRCLWIRFSRLPRWNPGSVTPRPSIWTVTTVRLLDWDLKMRCTFSSNMLWSFVDSTS